MKICPSSDPLIESHSWGGWCNYDPFIAGSSITDGFCHYRKCMNVGCRAEQRTVMLLPEGKTEVRILPDD